MRGPVLPSKLQRRSGLVVGRRLAICRRSCKQSAVKLRTATAYCVYGPGTSVLPAALSPTSLIDCVLPPFEKGGIM